MHKQSQKRADRDSTNSRKKAASVSRRIRELKRKLALLSESLESYREETRVQTDQLIETKALLEQSRDRYADLFDFAPVPYFILDHAGLVLNLNLTASTLLETERKWIVGFPLRRFIIQADRLLFLEHMRRCRCEAHLMTSELSCLTVRGHEIRAQLTSRRSLELGEHGHVFPTTVNDLTDRVRADETRNELLRQLVVAEERERQRLSRELHDQLGQHVTALALGLRVMENGASEQLRLKKLAELQSIVHELGQEAHRIALNLRPTALDDLGLQSALASYVDDWRARHDIRAEFHHSGPAEARLPAHLESLFYRVVQEALTNVAKHASATTADVLLTVTTTEASVVIEDNGQGFDVGQVFDPSLRMGRLGLLGMRERVQLSDGTLNIESTSAKGTTLFVRVPLSARGK